MSAEQLREEIRAEMNNHAVNMEEPIRKRVLRDLVDTLGLSWEMVTRLRRGAKLHTAPGWPNTDTAEWRAADAIATILDAAGVER